MLASMVPHPILTVEDNKSEREGNIAYPPFSSSSWPPVNVMASGGPTLMGHSAEH